MGLSNVEVEGMGSVVMETNVQLVFSVAVKDRVSTVVEQS